MIIDPKGLFEGQRLAACSTQTQHLWLRLIHAANNFGRLELHYPTIIAKYFRYIPDVPTEDQFISVIQELERNCLVVVYLAGEHWWLQFITPEKALLVYKNAEDRRSPEPPTEIMEALPLGTSAGRISGMQVTRAFQKLSQRVLEMFLKCSRNLRQSFLKSFVQV